MKLAKVLSGTTSDIQRLRRLHLGCGPRIIEGWANLDNSPRPGVCLVDLSKGIPAESGSIEYVYSEHFIEHLTLEQGALLLAECHRVLRPGGVMRVSTPALEKLVEQFSIGRTNEWTDVDWTPETPCRLLNEGMRSWGHQFIYDRSELERSLRSAGFSSVEARPYRSSPIPALDGLETRPFHEDLIFEATKG